MSGKNIKWDRDPEILARLETVAQMMIQGAQRWQIAQGLGVSLRTAARDMNRVRILWRRNTVEVLEDLRLEHREGIRFIQGQAYDQYLTDRADGYKWLKLALECERDLVDLDGVNAPLKVAPTDPTGKHEYSGDALSDTARLARVMAFLERARERRDHEGTGPGGPDGESDLSGVDSQSQMD